MVYENLLHGNSETSNWEVGFLLLGLQQLLLQLISLEGSSEGTGLLNSQILWLELGLFIDLLQFISLLADDDSLNSSNILSDDLDVQEVGSGSTSDLLDSQLEEFLLHSIQLLLEVFVGLISQFESFDFLDHCLLMLLLL